jgi:hypothetical protein
MDNQSALSEPLIVKAVDGEIAILGPDGLSGSLTVEAAVASAERLLAAARTIASGATPGEDDGEIYQKPLG